MQATSLDTWLHLPTFHDMSQVAEVPSRSEELREPLPELEGPSLRDFIALLPSEQELDKRTMEQGWK